MMRGNWDYLTRVKTERTEELVRKNLHGKFFHDVAEVVGKGS